ncbi:2-hydroxychromene-2-carboxylate isomerase [Palleronia caenipelagi]|uniref:2-hydroxychromene-2-carboxylate isomerase n=1 Tax=Palleronia caenipelagi TaxID=2489174 RepID=A0A547PQK6_9RHOB|nr:2-hydroxychromene-2-carboxylate isomerase [Palleronia caenipelagi]TRD16433.1 2-hydroxychromene-2-carboxylate isomerase [Palleronia caenipelagi]
MSRIDYYFSTLSPFTYLAGTRLEDIAARHGAEITYKPLDIMQLFQRTGGKPVPERHPNRQTYRLMELQRIADIQDMPINLKPRHWPTNGAPSAFAIIAAAKAGGGDLGALVHGFCRACWVEEKDIAEDAVIAEQLEAAGFDRGLGGWAMVEGAETYARNLEDAVNAGVFGAPFYITDDDQRFWGQDRLDHLDWHLGR